MPHLILLRSNTFLTCYTIGITNMLWTLSSIRVSNELGAKRPMETRFAVLVAVSTSIFMGSIFMGVVLIWRTSLPKLFSDSEEVIHGASKLGLLLALTVWMISICPVLSGSTASHAWQGVK
jgi:MATE family multidrug resistance protein